jgi:outer membrane lipoprotein-sorting protein
MQPIFPRPFLIFVLTALVFATFGARAQTAPRPLAQVRAELAILDPYAPDFDQTIERLMAEELAALPPEARLAGLD